MIKVKITYSLKNKKIFENKMLPYITGGGIFYKQNHFYTYIRSNKKYNASIILKCKSLSQLINTSTSMLRYCPDCILEDIKIIQSSINYKKKISNFPKRPIMGAILKPAIEYNPDIIPKIIKYAIKNNFDFIKDDDASEYNRYEAKKIKNMTNIPYFQKIINPSDSVSDYNMICPWINGWQILEEVSKNKISICHCANLPNQISWYAHIIFSRLAGADLTIVPDSNFDKTFNIQKGIKIANSNIKDVKTSKLIISGGITPKRINEILKKVEKSDRKNIGFAIGSYITKSIK